MSVSRFSESWITYFIGHLPPDSRVAVFVRESAEERLVLRAAAGCPDLAAPGVLGVASVPLADPPTSHLALAALHQRPVLVPSCLTDPNWRIPSTSYSAAFLVPWRAQNGSPTVLAFLSSHPGEFTERAQVYLARWADTLSHFCAAVQRLHDLEQAELRLAAIAHLAHSQQGGANQVVANEGPFPTKSPWLARDQGVHQRIAALSRREQEVLHAFRDHRRISGISQVLNISPHTVRNHLKSIFQKLGVHSQVELLAAVGPGEHEDSPENLDLNGLDDEEPEPLAMP